MCFSISIQPSSLKDMPSEINIDLRISAEPNKHLGDISPRLFTTLWHGRFKYFGAAFIAQPTTLALLGSPSHKAICPYVVTLPRGIFATIS